MGAGRWSSIAELNPLLHYLDTCGATLGAHQSCGTGLVVLGADRRRLDAGGMFATRQYRARCPTAKDDLAGYSRLASFSRGLRVTGRR